MLFSLINFNFEVINPIKISLHLPRFMWIAKKTLNNFTHKQSMKIQQKFSLERDEIKNDKYLKNFAYSNAKIKVLGIGGAGNNVLNLYLSTNKIHNPNVEFIAINTEEAPLKDLSKKCKTLLLGNRGLGSGSDPQVAAKHTEAQALQIKSLIDKADLVILVAAIGKGTGSGSTPVIAKLAKDLNISTLSMVFYPYTAASSQQKIIVFNDALNKIKYYSSSASIFNNNYFYNHDMTQFQAFEKANKFMANGLKNVLNLASHVYNEIDSCDFITFIKKRNQIAFFNFAITSKEISKLESNLNKMLNVYQIQKNNICQFIMTAENGKNHYVTESVARSIVKELKSFFGENDLDIFTASHQNPKQETMVNIMMSERYNLGYNVKQTSNSKTSIEPSLISENVLNARSVKRSGSAKLDIGNNAFINAKRINAKRSLNKIDLSGTYSTDEILYESVTKMICKEINTHKIHNKTKMIAS